MATQVFVMGSFVADLAFRCAHMPAWGETLLGSGFALGPGGKGSNQAVAAARALGGPGVQFLSKLGEDAFGQMARDLWRSAAIDDSLVTVSATPTGAAAILIDQATGENAIVVVPGACFTLSPEDVTTVAPAITSAKVFLTQLELPIATVERGLELAHRAGVPTILNPAPAPLGAFPDSLIASADYLIPNQSEAARLTGQPVETLEQAEAAAAILANRGARHIIVTVGAKGALVCAHGRPAELVPAFDAGPVIETTGAGDAFCGAFAAALSQGSEIMEAVRFACAAAAISVTRSGTAPAMPLRDEIAALKSRPVVASQRSAR